MIFVSIELYSYRKIKDSVLYNSKGIVQKNNYAIAEKERALLDIMYLNKEYYFDNLSKINWDKCRDIVNIYSNKQLEKRLEKLIKKHAQHR